jgi:hypothetical protein
VGSKVRIVGAGIAGAAGVGAAGVGAAGVGAAGVGVAEAAVIRVTAEAAEAAGVVRAVETEAVGY